MGDHRMYHFASVIVPKSYVSIFMRTDSQRQRRVADNPVNLFINGGYTVLAWFQTDDSFARLCVEDDGMRTIERRYDTIWFVVHKIHARWHAVCFWRERIKQRTLYAIRKILILLKKLFYQFFVYIDLL